MLWPLAASLLYSVQLCCHFQILFTSPGPSVQQKFLRPCLSLFVSWPSLTPKLHHFALVQVKFHLSFLHPLSQLFNILLDNFLHVHYTSDFDAICKLTNHASSWQTTEGPAPTPATCFWSWASKLKTNFYWILSCWFYVSSSTCHTNGDRWSAPTWLAEGSVSAPFPLTKLNQTYDFQSVPS